MNNDDIKKLALDLLRADAEEDVVRILNDAGLWDNRDLWRLYGDKEGNFAQAGNQQSLPEAALVEKVVKNAVLIAREIGPTYLQLYTPCILEIGKNSMEGLQEMRDAEKPGERFAYKEYMSDEARAFLADLAEKEKTKKTAAKEALTQA